MNKKSNLKLFKFPNNIAKLEKQVEAILFAAEEPLDAESIQEKLKTHSNINKILDSLEKQYKNRGINLVCIAKKWSFRTASNLSKFMNLQTHTKKKLSKAAIETLAIIVYHQPVTRSEIEEIRGVSFATGTLEILLELNWVRPSGRKDVPGKPIQYVTTDDFLSHFNLQKLSDLPNIEELSSAGLIDNSNVDTTIFGTGKFFKEQMAEKKEKVILVRMETSPEDIHGMSVSQGILTARGGMTSHAAVVARAMGKPCVSGVQVQTSSFVGVGAAAGAAAAAAGAAAGAGALSSSPPHATISEASSKANTPMSKARLIPITYSPLSYSGNSRQNRILRPIRVALTLSEYSNEGNYVNQIMGL